MTIKSNHLKPYPQALAWSDTETGGLNGIQTLKDGTRVNGAEYYPILEVAIMLPETNENGLVELFDVPAFNVGIKMTQERMDRMDDWPLTQHTNSGLLERLKSGEGFDYLAATTEEAEIKLIEWLEINGVSTFDSKAGTGAILCGNNVGFDLSFIDAQMPKLARYFHYRKGDVSAVNIFSRSPLWKHTGLTGIDKKGAHTALSDITESVLEMNAYTQVINELLWYKEQAQKAGIMYPGISRNDVFD